MKICVIGTVIKDYLFPFNGGMIQGIGGIHFTISHLSAIFRTRDEIIPLSYVGKDIYNDFINIVKKCKNVSIEGLFKYPRRNNSVTLKYNSKHERMEISKFPLPPISIEKIKPYLNCDFLIINLISGWDIKISTLEKIRARFSGKIYLDVHSYLLGRKRNGERYYRKPEDFQKWFDLVDYIQFNENEFNILNSENLSLEDFFTNYCISEEKLINLTLGAKGSKCVYWNNGQIKTIVKKANKIVEERDPTGCGDAFMAGFVFGILSNKKIEKSLELANYVASLNCEYYGVPEVDSLRVRLKQKRFI